MQDWMIEVKLTSNRRWQWKAADEDDDNGGNCSGDGSGGRATANSGYDGSRAEAMAAET